MSLAALAAAATVYDTIEEVAWDTGSGLGFTAHRIRANGIATVLHDGTVHMDEGQSLVAADIIARAERVGTW